MKKKNVLDPLPMDFSDFLGLPVNGGYIGFEDMRLCLVSHP